jgi:hypothetical protein
MGEVGMSMNKLPAVVIEESGPPREIPDSQRHPIPTGAPKRPNLHLPTNNLPAHDSMHSSAKHSDRSQESSAHFGKKPQLPSKLPPLNQPAIDHTVAQSYVSGLFSRIKYEHKTSGPFIPAPIYITPTPKVVEAPPATTSPSPFARAKTKVIFDDDDSEAKDKTPIKRKLTPKKSLIHEATTGVVPGKEDANLIAATDYVNGLFSRIMPDDEVGDDGQVIGNNNGEDTRSGGIFE